MGVVWAVCGGRGTGGRERETRRADKGENKRIKAHRNDSKFYFLPEREIALGVGCHACMGLDTSNLVHISKSSLQILKTSFFHNSCEFLLSHPAITIAVSFLNHLLQLLLLHRYPQLRCNPPQVLQPDTALALCIKQLKHPRYLILRMILLFYTIGL